MNPRWNNVQIAWVALFSASATAALFLFLPNRPSVEYCSLKDFSKILQFFILPHNWLIVLFTIIVLYGVVRALTSLFNEYPKIGHFKAFLFTLIGVLLLSLLRANCF